MLTQKITQQLLNMRMILLLYVIQLSC